jgi:hypothetical protein
MVLSYVPCDVNHFSDIIQIYCDLTDTINPLEKEKIFLEFIDDNFCKHIHKRSKNKDGLCLSKINYKSIYCKRHTPKVLIKCYGKNRYGEKCRRNVKQKGQLCIYCIKKNVKTYKCLINISNLFIIEESYKYSHEVVPFFDFNNKFLQHLNKYNVLFYILLIIITGKNENKMHFHMLDKNKIGYNQYAMKPDYPDKDKQLVIYEHKKQPIFVFDDNIYKYLFKFNYDKIYKIIKKIYNKDFSNIISLFGFKKIKKYKENFKKRERQKRKKQKEKERSLLYIKEEIINVNILNNEELIQKIDCGYIDLKVWPISYETYKDFIPHKVLYFHTYYNITNDNNKKSILLFYQIDGIFNSERISYNELYNLFIKEYNLNSVSNFIKYYFKNFKK